MAMIEKAMYIKGLCDGVDLDKTTKEGKLIAALLDIVTEMATEMDEMQAKISELEDYCEELDEDLGDVEEVLLDIDEDDLGEDEDFDPEEYLDDFDFDEDEDEDEDTEYFEVICPSCGDAINFDSSIDPENLCCPNCGERFECIVEDDDLKTVDGVEDEE